MIDEPDEDDEIYWYLLECNHYGSSTNHSEPNATRLRCEVCPSEHPPVTRRLVKRIPSYLA